MRTAQKGDTVRVHFTGSFDNGSQFASTLGEEPIEITIGEGKLIECFEKSLIGMSEGVKKNIRLEPAEAVGEKKPELISTVPRHSIQEDNQVLKVGRRVEAKDEKGNTIIAAVKKLSDHKVTIDANHPLAGKALIFDIKLLEFV
jgi:peptidylprolyl isomerase